MPLFDIPERRTKEQDASILQRSKKKSTPTVTKSGGGISSKISTIKAMVNKHLGKYADESMVLEQEEEIAEYIDKATADGYVAIDTETTGLDPLQDDLVGVCLYTHNEKTVYIPVGHKSYVTGADSKHNVDKEILTRHLSRLERSGTRVIMFNATFDTRMIKNHLGVDLECYWDCSIASRCMNENEPEKGLKKLHQKYVLRGKEDAFKFEELFKGVNFAYVPVDTGYLYAAHDSKITMELFDYQRQYLYYDPAETPDSRNGMNGVAWVFFNIEMPCVAVTSQIEDNGVEFDFEFQKELAVKYHKILDEKLENFIKTYKMYDKEIAEYRGDVRFDDPININSVPQLQALLYDIIGLKGPIDKKTKKPSRSTGEEVLLTLKDNAVVQAILDYREFSTLVSTFIDKLPNCVNPKDGRIHCKFNQYGADTGRFSSKDPNLQNIPSHNKEIRKMFKATDGYVMMSSDFSQQEVVGMAQMCGDEGMLQAFRDGKDFYAQIASVSFNKSYRDCLEFETDENGEFIYDKYGEKITNPSGKERRGQAKSILLGINYGRGAQSIAEQLGCSKQKAEKIKEDVFSGFPAIENFQTESLAMAEDLGYVTTLWGRKRRLPILTLPDYEFEWLNGASLSNDPLDFDDSVDEDEVPDEVIDAYLKRLKGVWGGDKKRAIIKDAKDEGIKITDHTADKIKAVRQVVNSRIQGTAADQSKLAMIALHNDERLRELGFRMLIPVHDEIIAECPKENAREVKERFQYIMEHSGESRLTIPIHCDVTCSDRWFGESIEI